MRKASGSINLPENYESRWPQIVSTVNWISNPYHDQQNLVMKIIKRIGSRLIYMRFFWSGNLDYLRNALPAGHLDSLLL